MVGELSKLCGAVLEGGGGRSSDFFLIPTPLFVVRRPRTDDPDRFFTLNKDRES